MTSTSSLGSTSGTLQFALDSNLDAAAQDVLTGHQPHHLLAARRHALFTWLPQGEPGGLSYPLPRPRLQPKTIPLYEPNELAETRMAQRISRVRGVA